MVCWMCGVRMTDDRGSCVDVLLSVLELVVAGTTEEG